MSVAEYYKQIVEASLDGVMQIDATGHVAFTNRNGCRLLGIKEPEQSIERTWVSLWPESSRVRAGEALQGARRGKRMQFTSMSSGPKREEKWWMSTLTPLLDDAGQVQSVLIISRDITEQMRVQDALDAITRNLKSRLTVVSAAQHAGAQRETALQEKLDIATLAQSVAEQVSRQAQKSEAIGQLVAGIAHDFNNMLQTATMSLSAVLDRPERLANDQRRMLEYAMEGVRHAAILAKRLLGFARVHAYQPELVEVRALAAGIEGFIQQSMGPGISLLVDDSAGEYFTFADPHSIEQALMNLCINARDACDQSGPIAVAFGRMSISDDVASTIRAPGEYVTISVSDEGSGMSAATRERLFEPYFTTKAEGKGTGLGLAQVYGLMRQWGGFVDVQSQPGVGTTMTLAFPRAGSNAAGEMNEPVEISAPA
ncbi:nitrogen regulation protein NR(II) [Rhodanobacter ginsengisoli]|uniref:histidine kinase n=1 Tax=Rhodanobacter ginsengisoli TaxID=418646 RepID=A0ABW0QIZ2_9GAMM